jgi:prepilin-type N-terminal cleavage/methylation domain-containing protein
MRKLSGFTLIECLVALMVLGMLSVSLAGLYAAVASARKENEYMNYSLAEQMKYVEKKTDTEGVVVQPSLGQVAGEKSATIPAPATGTYQVAIAGGPVDSTVTSVAASGYIKSNEYAFGVNMYILYSRDILDRGSDDAAYSYYDESSGKLRYKYLQPRTPGAIS